MVKYQRENVVMFKEFGDYVVLTFDAGREAIEAAKEELMKRAEKHCAENCKKPFEAYKFTMQWVIKKFEKSMIPARYVYGKNLPEGMKADDLVENEEKTTVGLKFSVPPEDLIHPEIAE